MQLSFKRNNKSDELLLHIYKELLYPRMIEEKMLNLLRQGQISKWFSGIGQEAISVGTVVAMDKEDAGFASHPSQLNAYGRRLKIILSKVESAEQFSVEENKDGELRNFYPALRPCVCSLGEV